MVHITVRYDNAIRSVLFTDEFWLIVVLYESLCRGGKGFALHLFKGKTERARDRVWATGEVIAPDQDRFAGREDAVMFSPIAYLVFHDKAGASYMHDAHANLGGIGANQGEHIGAGHFFNEDAVVPAIRARLDAWATRWMGD